MKLLPTFPQAVATFPAQTQRHGRVSELPFLTQRNACPAASQSVSPDSTCHTGDLGFISPSHMPGDGRWGDKIPDGQQMKHEHQKARSRGHTTAVYHGPRERHWVSEIHPGTSSASERKLWKNASRTILSCFLEQQRKVQTSRGFTHSAIIFMEKSKLKWVTCTRSCSNKTEI